MSEMRTIQLKILEILGAKLNGKKIPGKKVSKIWVYLVRLSSFLKILEKAVPFATGSCRKFKPDILVEWKAPFIFNSLLQFLFPRARCPPAPRFTS